MKQRTILVLYTIAIVLRLLSLIPEVIDDDESWFIASSSVLSHPMHFFQTALDNKPPGTVWFYSIVSYIFSLDFDLRIPRFFSILCFICTSIFIYKISYLVLNSKQNALYSSFVFFICSALPSPKLLATTTEGLMLPAVCYLYWVILKAWIQKKSISYFACLGLLFSFCMLFFLKQTSLVLLFPLMLWLIFLYKRKLISKIKCLVFVMLFIAIVCLLIFLMQANDFIYWTIVYPFNNLTKTRNSLFDSERIFFTNTALFFIAQWPLLLSTLEYFRKIFQNPFDEVTLMLLSWVFSACAAIYLGKGLFLHYYLYVLPVLCLFLKNKIKLTSLCWFYLGYLVVCTAVAFPQLGVLWGTDLNYYSKLAKSIEEMTTKEDCVVIWGGNAMALSLSQRKPCSPFITARFASPQYGTESLQKKFYQKLLHDKPKLFVDLHNRNDNRFNVDPLSIKALRELLIRWYSPVRSHALPWVVFYVYNDQLVQTDHQKKIENAKNKFNLEFDVPYTVLASVLKRYWYRLLPLVLVSFKDVLEFEHVLRIWESLRLLRSEYWSKAHRNFYYKINDFIYSQINLLRQGQIGRVPLQEFLDEFQLLKMSKISNESDKSQGRSIASVYETPLPLESMAWWLSFAMQRFQLVFAYSL